MKVKPVGFQMSDYVFEINPQQYLYKSSHNKCYFVIHKCRLPGKNKNLYLIGDAFLKHFYSVYDFDKDTVSLGINKHSEGKVRMYKPEETTIGKVSTEGIKTQGLVQQKRIIATDDDDNDDFVQTMHEVKK